MSTFTTSSIALAAAFLSAPAWAQTFEIIEGRKVVPNEVIVKFRPGVHIDAGSYAARTLDLRQRRELNGMGLTHFRSGSRLAAQLVKELSADPDVEYAEPNYIVETQSATASGTPNDPMFSLLWGLQNTGQNSGLPLADIEAAPAWRITTGTRSVVVGVVDTGFDYNHPDLKPNIWSAPAPFTVQFGPNDSITCAAGTHGYDAITNTCNPMDDNGHGTHVSGTIGAAGNNNSGVTGVNWTTSMIGLRFMDSNGKGTVSNAIRAIQFAIQVKAALPDSAAIRVLSNSWGGSGNSQALLDTINQANAAGILFVAAAGNDGQNQDVIPSYPGAYRTANVISVAATDNTDALAGFSNYGSTMVDLGAPGVDIASTYLGSSYAYMTGTSMATPHVAGAAALVLAACGSLDTATLRSTLVGSVDPVAGLVGKTVSGGRLNVHKALNACATGSSTPPASTPPAVRSFTFSAPPDLALAAGGAAAEATIVPASVNGFTGSIGLSITGLPAGLSATIAPTSVTPGTPATLKVTALASAVAGKYTFMVNGVSGQLTYSALVSVTVTGSPNFKLTVTPSASTIQYGTSSVFQITPVATGGFAGTISLQFSGLPPYSTTKFTQQPGTSTMVMTVTPTRRTLPKSYSVVIVGTAPSGVGSESLKQSVPITLKVTN